MTFSEVHNHDIQSLAWYERQRHSRREMSMLNKALVVRHDAKLKPDDQFTGKGEKAITSEVSSV